MRSLVGELDLDLDVLGVPSCDLRLVLHTAAAGTPTHRALRRLRAAAGIFAAG